MGLAESMSGKGTLPGLQMDIFLNPHRTEKEKEFWYLPLLIKD